MIPRSTETAVAEAKALNNSQPPRPAPPRPSGFGTTKKVRPTLKAHSEPPPSDCTQVYDQRELSRLLVETDPTLAQDVLDSAFSDTSTVQVRTTHESPTVRPPAFEPLNKTKPVAVETRNLRPTIDTEPDTEELTIAYRRPAIVPPDAIIPVVAEKKAIVPSLRFENAERTVVAPLQFELEEDSDPSHRTGPKTRPATIRPSSPRKRTLKPWFLGASCFAIGLLIAVTALPASFGKPGKALHTQYARAKIAILEHIAPKALATAPVIASKVRLIELNVVVEPPQAKLFLDGHETSNPLKVAYPADNSVHELRATVEGRAPITHQLKFDRDISIVLGF